MILMVTMALPTRAQSDEFHSDQLLFLLQQKIMLKQLQSEFPSLGLHSEHALKNIRSQTNHLKNLTELLPSYVNTPESRYPNMSEYHLSLTSRAELLNEVTDIIVTYHQQAHKYSLQ